MEELRDIVAKYPFFQTARLLYVANLYQLHDAAFGKELRKASVMVPDRTALFSLTEGENYTLETVSPSGSLIETENDHNRTISLIDSFLTNSKNIKFEEIPAKKVSIKSVEKKLNGFTEDLKNAKDLKGMFKDCTDIDNILFSIPESWGIDPMVFNKNQSYCNFVVMDKNKKFH